LLRIATAADFCGTRWQVNAVMIPTPGGRAYLMPVARVMQLYRQHCGTHAAAVSRAPEGLDVAASIRGETLFLHVANTHRAQSSRTQLQVDNRRIMRGRVWEIVDDPAVEVSQLNCDQVMKTCEKPLPHDGVWEFPAASVSAVELQLEPSLNG
jgi:hypothetical protein